MPIHGGNNSEVELFEKHEHRCETLLMCFVTTLNEGLRNGGGIGDILRKPSISVSGILFCLLNGNIFRFFF